MNISQLQNKKIAILGFGQEGKSTLQFLLREGIEDITVLDKNEIDLSPFVKRSTAKQGGIVVVTGNNYLDNLENYDVIIKSPGVSPFQKELLPYREKFISQTQIFFSHYRGKVIGITGTKGKSTISTLLTQCLVSAGYDAVLVGNIGVPVLDEIDIHGEMHDFVVYELSSYMLQDFSPDLYIGFLNNIYPCHLDWHYDSFNIYREAKGNILRNATTKILHGDLATDSEIRDIDGEKIYFDSKGSYSFDERYFYIGNDTVYSGDIKLLGAHNRKNICGIIAILDTIISKKEAITQALYEILPTFGGLPNRIEDIGVFEGISFINDAIATTPESTMAAIDTFQPDLQTLFVGGQDSGFDFKNLRKKILDSNISNLVLFPDTGEIIFPELELRDYEKAFEIEIENKILQCIKTRSMHQAVDFAYKTTLPGKTVLLSCAAPSFSLWQNYLEKAKEFTREVQNY